MVRKRFKYFVLILALASQAAAAQAQKERSKPLSEQELMDKVVKGERVDNGIRPPSGASFYIAPITELPGQFSVLIADENNRTVTGSYRASQLETLEAILTEAVNFARTDEGVGKTTRFMGKSEPSFIIDVEKTPKDSRYYFTLSYLSSRVTVNIGSIARDGKEKGLVLNILDRVKSTRSGG